MIQKIGMVCLMTILANTSIKPEVKVVNPPMVAISKPKVVTKPKTTAIKPKASKTGVVTTYAKKFEGRKMASGVRFSHNSHYVASRCFAFGTKIRMSYGRHSAIVTVMDRGGLPLHRPNRVQFDLPQKVAKELGLYKLKNGETDRLIKYEVIK